MLTSDLHNCTHIPIRHEIYTNTCTYKIIKKTENVEISKREPIHHIKWILNKIIVNFSSEIMRPEWSDIFQMLKEKTANQEFYL